MPTYTPNPPGKTIPFLSSPLVNSVGRNYSINKHSGKSTGNPGEKTKANSLVFVKVLQSCGNIMGTSQLLIHQDIDFATPPVHHFIHKTGCLVVLLCPRRNDPLLEAIVKPVDHYKKIGREFAA